MSSFFFFVFIVIKIIYFIKFVFLISGIKIFLFQTLKVAISTNRRILKVFRELNVMIRLWKNRLKSIYYDMNRYNYQH